MAQKTRDRFVEYLDSPWFGIGVGIMIGAYGSLLSVKWLIGAGWLLVSIQMFRHDFFEKGMFVRIITNLGASGALLLVLAYLWWVVPKPPEQLRKGDIPPPLSEEQIQEAIAKQAPAIARAILPLFQAQQQPTTLTQVTQAIRDSFTSPSELANLSAKRLNYEVDITLREVLSFQGDWNSKLSVIESEIRDGIQFFKKAPNGTWNSMDPQTAAAFRQEGEARKADYSSQMRERSRSSMSRLCDLRRELLLNRLKPEEIAGLDNDERVSNLCQMIATFPYSLDDMERLSMNMAALQQKLEIDIKH